MRKSVRSALVLAAIALLTFAVAAFAAQFRPGAWYQALHKPAWTPPDAVFPVVWSMLYALMSIAAWQYWRAAGWARAGWMLYGSQLLANGVWSWLFFGQHRIGAAFADVVLLWLLIGATLLVFWRRSPIAGALLIPYWLWVGYAAGLNFEIWRVQT